jgi:NAD(P) transhydrogenase subunit alpha
VHVYTHPSLHDPHGMCTPYLTGRGVCVQAASSTCCWYVGHSVPATPWASTPSPSNPHTPLASGIAFLRTGGAPAGIYIRFCGHAREIWFAEMLWNPRRYFIGNMMIFVLASVLGYCLCANVKPSLHTPLMSMSNAISGIVIIGGMYQIQG